MSLNAILVHGAWQGGWVWDDIVPMLADPEALSAVLVQAIEGFD